MAAWLAAGACARPAPSFSMLLARIDADPALVDPAPFLGAATLARDTADRLSLIKRAYRRSPALAARVCDAIIGAGQVSAPVSRAVFSSFLDAGMPDKALRLFDGLLSPEEAPALYAEAYAACRVTGAAVATSPSLMVVAFDATGQGQFLVQAALLSMAQGDVQSASIVLADAVARGVAVDPFLLWDAAAYAQLVESASGDDEPERLHLAADAAWSAGMVAEASSLYLRLVELYPLYSWKPYAALARLAQAGPEAAPMEPVSPLGSAWPREGTEPIREREAPGEHWIALMAERFPGDAGALRERVAHYQRQGMAVQAMELAAQTGVGDEDSAVADIASYASVYPDTVAPRAMARAAAFPDSAAVQETALACLLSVGAWKEFSTTLSAARIELPRAWFWEAVALALKGEPAAAADLIRSRGSGADRWAAPFDLGLMELAAGRYREAALAFVTAAGEATRPKDRARAYELAGDSWRLAGDRSAGRDAYKAALSVDPNSLSARAGLELIGDK